MKAPLRTLLIALFLFSAPFFAQATVRSDLLAKLEELRETVRALTAELRLQIAQSSKDFKFDRNLVIGSRGADVERLQLFLSLYTQFYPEGYVTGYYGELTSAAIERFKKEYGITEIGFGKQSRESMNELLSKTSTFVVVPTDLLASDSAHGLDGESASQATDFSTKEIARSIHDEINRVREENGLNTLDWSEDVAEVALQHAKDQARDNLGLTAPGLLCQYPTIRHEGFVNGYLVRDRVQSAKIPFRSVGENIAMIPAIKTRSYSFSLNEKTPECPERQTFVIGKATDKAAYEKSLDDLLVKAKSIEPVTFIREDYYSTDRIIELAIDGWMDSPGHRENILYPDYTSSGVGVVKVNEYYIITHDFVGK